LFNSNLILSTTLKKVKCFLNKCSIILFIVRKDENFRIF